MAPGRSDRADTGETLGAATFYAGGEWGAVAWSNRGLVAMVLDYEAEAEAGEELTAAIERGPAALRGAAAGLRRLAVNWVPEPAFPLAAAIDRYFAGQREDFASLPVDLSVQPPFTAAVLASVREVPYGEVRSYGWVAARAGNPRAFRATGQAVGRNPLPLLVPCHRIIGGDGRLVGFGSGHGALERKARLLAVEGHRLSDRRAAADTRIC